MMCLICTYCSLNKTYNLQVIYTLLMVLVVKSLKNFFFFLFPYASRVNVIIAYESGNFPRILSFLLILFVYKLMLFCLNIYLTYWVYFNINVCD